MTSNRFSFKLVRETMRRNIWAAALSLVGFFFCLPLPAAMLIQNRIANANDPGTSKAEQLGFAADDIRMLLSANNIFAKLGICIMAVLCGVALFSYLHSRQKVDFYHSIPLKRGALFLNNYVSGILMVLPALLVMYALTAVISAVMGVPADNPNSITGSGIAEALLAHVLFFLFIYTVSVLATILTGNTILAVLLDGWMLCSIPAVGMIGQALGQQYLRHWNGSGILDWICYNTSPVILYFSVGSDDYFWGRYGRSMLAQSATTFAAVLVITVLLFLLSYVLFQRRKSERAGTAIAFESLKMPLKCYMVLLIAFVLGLIFLAIGGEFWVWFGLLAGTVLGHLLIEMIYHFDFRAAFAHWKTMIVLAVAAVAVMLGVQNDVMGYDQWIPDGNKVASVGFITSLGNTQAANNTGLWDVSIHNMQQDGGLLTDPQSIAAIRKLAEIGIQSENEDGSVGGDDSPYNEWGYLDVYYQMKNGLTESRSYSIPNCDEVWALMDAIRFTEEYQAKANPLFRIDLDEAGQTLSLTVRANAEPSEGSGKFISDTAKVREIVETLREETLTLTPEAVKSVPVLRIDIGCKRQENGDRYSTLTEYVPVYGAFSRTLALLAAEGVEPEALTADGLSHITLNWNSNGQAESAAASHESFETETVYDANMEKYGGFAVITDKAEMQKLLENAVLEPVAASCDTSLKMQNNGGQGIYYLTANFPDGRACPLYYADGKFPTVLCDGYRSAAQKPAA